MLVVNRGDHQRSLRWLRPPRSGFCVHGFDFPGLRECLLPQNIRCTLGCLSFTASRFAVMEIQDVYNNEVGRPPPTLRDRCSADSWGACGLDDAKVGVVYFFCSKQQNKAED